jgi:hypothetical protein
MTTGDSRFLEACAQPGCPVCRLSLDVVRRYLDSILNEFVNDLGSRSRIREARGYCNEHAWFISEGLGNALGVAIIQNDIVHTVLGILEKGFRGRKARQGARDLLERLKATAECTACDHRRRAEDMALKRLVGRLRESEVMDALVRSSGLCLPHFSRALEWVEDVEGLRQLVSAQRQTLGELREDLVQFIRKNEHRFRGEGFGKEANSSARATGIVSGERRGRAP